MENKIIYAITILVILLISIMFFFALQPAKKPITNKYMVEISGSVTYDEYKTGKILVLARTNLSPNNKLATTVLLKPGKYILKVSKNIGEIYLDAGNIPEDYEGGYHSGFPWGRYSNNPLEVKDADMPGIDIKIVPKGSQMAVYRGPTIKISGRVTFEGDRKGNTLVSVVASSIPSVNTSKGFRDTDFISNTEFFESGEYTLNLPKNAGNVYLFLVYNIPRQKDVHLYLPPFPYIAFRENPIKVESIDLYNIDFIIPAEG